MPGTLAGCNWFGANGEDGCNQNITDNATLTIYKSDLVSYNDAAVGWVAANAIDPTALDAQIVSSAGSTTDVVVYDGYYASYCGIDWSMAAGFTRCATVNTASECEKQEVRLDLADSDGFGTTRRRELACHEIGHAIGLTHADDTAGCMPASGWTDHANYTNHDKEHFSNDVN